MILRKGKTSRPLLPLMISRRGITSRLLSSSYDFKKRKISIPFLRLMILRKGKTPIQLLPLIYDKRKNNIEKMKNYSLESFIVSNSNPRRKSGYTFLCKFLILVRKLFSNVLIFLLIILSSCGSWSIH
jgi:hypothetical protein